ncbi:hypothetical protein ACI7YT_12465 [Microbacterium sp. M]|uniref:hypothetical protein n=1 Tax=Microbacterium sp. M TaxID=3377125 RepID=UPI00386D2173
MSRQEWADKLYPLIAQTARIDPIRAEHHPAFRGALRRIDSLIAYGLEHAFITPEEAARA